jgi:hypothetical protein
MADEIPSSDDEASYTDVQHKRRHEHAHRSAPTNMDTDARCTTRLRDAAGSI